MRAKKNPAPLLDPADGLTDVIYIDRYAPGEALTTHITLTAATTAVWHRTATDPIWRSATGTPAPAPVADALNDMAARSAA